MKNKYDTVSVSPFSPATPNPINGISIYQNTSIICKFYSGSELF